MAKRKNSHKTSYPGVNCEEAMRPGLRPTAAAMAAMLALVGSCAAPCSAADKLDAATITCPVPSVFTSVAGAWVMVFADSWVTNDSANIACGALGEGLSEGDGVAVVTVGTVAMVDAVLAVAEPTVEPEERTVQSAQHPVYTKCGFKKKRVLKTAGFHLFMPRIYAKSISISKQGIPCNMRFIL